MLTGERTEAANSPDTIPPQAFSESLNVRRNRVRAEGFGI